MSAGRPTKYEARYAAQAYKFCLLGATDEQLADFFEVDVSTISNWKNDQPKFLEALKKGKEAADAKVAESLYKRATGYSHPEVDVKMYEGEIIQTKLTKHYPPDSTAIIYWLNNRQKEKWRTRNNTELSGPNSGPIEVKAALDMLDNDLGAHARQALDGPAAQK